MSASLDKSVNISILLDFYGCLLGERQREIIGYYYNDDLSLSEIAELLGITRQGVRESIKKSEDMLETFERKLGLMRRSSETAAKIKEAADMIMTLEISESSARKRDEIIKFLTALAE